MNQATAFLARTAPALAHPPRPLAPQPSGMLTGYDGLMLEAVGLTVPVGSVCKVQTARGHSIDAEVVGFRADRLLLMSYADVADLLPGARVSPTAGGALVRVGDGLIGRVVDGVGQPIDDLGPTFADVLTRLPARPTRRRWTATPYACSLQPASARSTRSRHSAVASASA